MVNFMKKIISSVGIMALLLFIMFEMLTSSTSIMNTVIFSFDVWKNSIFPSLFPFFVLSEFLVNYGFVDLVSEFFKPIMNKFFKLRDVLKFLI